MYIITLKEDDVILEIANDIETLNNNYIYSKETNMSYPNFLINYYNVETVPENIKDFQYQYINGEYIEIPKAEEEDVENVTVDKEENIDKVEEESLNISEEQ